MTLASIYERVHTSLLQVCGNVDGARIHAQNAIRKKSEQLNYLRLSSRLDAVASRLDTQAKMNHHGYGGARLDATGALTRQPAPARVFVRRGKHAATSHEGSCPGMRQLCQVRLGTFSQ